MRQDDRIRSLYFEWMLDFVCGKRYARGISYRRLLEALHDTIFTYTIKNDVNRYEDGISLRYRFACSNPEVGTFYYIEDCLYAPCSVLEMMLALSIKCEEEIMDDPKKGDRTAQWFWGMVTTLGLGGMSDSAFDEEEFKYIIRQFLSRRYAANGKGGLFFVRDSDRDMRDAEIWNQMCWYLNTIT